MTRSSNLVPPSFPPSLPVEAEQSNGASQTTSAPSPGNHHSPNSNRLSWYERSRQIPSWLTSLVLHLAILLFLALFRFDQIGSSTLNLFLGKQSSTSAEFELGTSEGSDVEWAPEEVVEPAFLQAESNLAEIAKSIQSDLEPPQLSSFLSISKMLSGRLPGNRASLLASGGGTAATEQAVELGLQWLVRNQLPNGSWSLTGKYSDGADQEDSTAATAMALNAFLGAGYTHLEGKYSEVVSKGIRFLLQKQASNGFFALNEPAHHQAYAQALATITLLEAFGLTQDEELRGPATRAVHYAEWAQSDLKGWRYQPKVDADVSVTGWYVMALHTARTVGFETDEVKIQSVHDYLDSVSFRNSSAYAYKERHGPDLTMTAEALLCRILLGWPRTHPALRVGVTELAANPPEQSSPVQSVYYWYYATQVLHHFGGPEWESWNAQMKNVLPAMQIQSGPEVGSWGPERDIYGRSGGRLYTTCLNIYCLEVYYRHLAVYSIE